MQNADHDMGELLARIVKQCLREGDAVSLDGIGTFEPGDGYAMHFIAESAPRLFIAYVQEDAALAQRLADGLEAAGLKPWLDKRRLLPGQNWREAIAHAIERSDFFIACFSQTAVRKRGQFPHEVRLALRCADRMPLDDTFVIPVRFEVCVIPQRIQSSIQHVDLFADWDIGLKHLTDSIWHEFAERLDRAVSSS